MARRIVQLQDELAVHKAFASNRAGDPDTVVAVRQQITTERKGAMQ